MSNYLEMGKYLSFLMSGTLFKRIKLKMDKLLKFKNGPESPPEGATREGRKPTYLGTLARTLRTQGIEGLQAGLSIAIVREGTKNIFRIGCYDPILAQIHPDEDPKSAPVWKRLVAGATSGTVAAVSCNPVDIVKTRMQGKGAGARALSTPTSPIRRIRTQVFLS